MAEYWTVRVRYEGKVSEGWDYAPSTFPRRFISKRGAEEFVREVQSKGGRGIAITKEKVPELPTKEATDARHGIGIPQSRNPAELLSQASGR